MKTSYNKESLLKIIPLLARDQVPSFLLEHQNDLAQITREDDICDIVFYLLDGLSHKSDDDMYTVLKPFAPQLSSFNSFRHLHDLLKQLLDDKNYDLRKVFVCATVMRSAIISGSQLTAMIDLISKVLKGDKKRQRASNMEMASFQQFKKDFFDEQKAFWQLQDPSTKQLRFEENCLLDTMKYLELSTNEIMPFLEEHKSDLASITNKNYICAVIQYALDNVNSSMYFNKYESKDENTRRAESNQKNIDTVINYFKKQLSSFTDLSPLVNLCLSFKNDIFKYNNAAISLARAARASIHTVDQLAEIIATFSSAADRGIFIKEQEAYWAKLKAEAPVERVVAATKIPLFWESRKEVAAPAFETYETVNTDSSYRA